MSPSEIKTLLRAQALERLAAHPATATESAALQERIVALPQFAAAQVVSLFMPLPGEPAADLLWLRSVGKTIVCPGMGPNGPDLRLASSPAEMRRTKRGFFEPPAGDPIEPQKVDLFVVPGLAFDRAGLRLGRGGGYYDRLLAKRRRGAVIIGVLPERLLAEALPREPHDIPMTHVATERRLLTAPEEGVS